MKASSIEAFSGKGREEHGSQKGDACGPGSDTALTNFTIGQALFEDCEDLCALAAVII
jgi:hypothetical protein